jgi:hypothetical protein
MLFLLIHKKLVCSDAHAARFDFGLSLRVQIKTNIWSKWVWVEKANSLDSSSELLDLFSLVCANIRAWSGLDLVWILNSVIIRFNPQQLNMIC